MRRWTPPGSCSSRATTRYCHDALEAFFGELPGGYAALFRERDLGVPTVHLETDFKSPLRYGDVARFEMAIERVGRTSLTFRHTIHRESDATVERPCVTSW